MELNIKLQSFGNEAVSNHKPFTNDFNFSFDVNLFNISLHVIDAYLLNLLNINVERRNFCK